MDLLLVLLLELLLEMLLVLLLLLLILSNDFRLGHGGLGYLGLLFRSWARFGALLGAVGRSFGAPPMFCVRPWPV